MLGIQSKVFFKKVDGFRMIPLLHEVWPIKGQDGKNFLFGGLNGVNLF